MRDWLIFFLIAALVFIVAISELMAAVLPILIVVTLVPPHERAELAELIAEARGTSRFGMRAVMRAAMAVRKRRMASRGTGSSDAGVRT